MTDQIIFDNNHLFLLHEADDMNCIEKSLLLQQMAEMKQKLFPIQIFEGKRYRKVSNDTMYVVIITSSSGAGTEIRDTVGNIFY